MAGYFYSLVIDFCLKQWNSKVTLEEAGAETSIILHKWGLQNLLPLYKKKISFGESKKKLGREVERYLL